MTSLYDLVTALNGANLPVSVSEAINLQSELPGLLYDLLTVAWQRALISEQVNDD